MGAGRHLQLNAEQFRGEYAQPVNLTLKDTRHGALRAEGHQQDAIDEVERLLTAHGQDAASQRRAHDEIKQHIANDTPVGRALLDHIELEESALDAYDREHDRRVEDAEKRARQEHRENRWSSDFESEDDAAEDARKRMERRRGHKVYRAESEGEDARHIHSWTTQRGGAGSSLAGRGASTFAPTKEAKLEDLRKQGWRVLGGVGRMMGAPGESEVTLIHLGRVGKTSQKAKQLKAFREVAPRVAQVGKRGGRFILTASGKKSYIGKK